MIVRENEILFAENDPGDRMYIVRSGKVRIFKRAGQQIKILAELGAGRFFGETSLLDKAPRSATVQAMEDTEVDVVGPEMLERTLQEQPSWFRILFHALTSRLRETTIRKAAQDRLRSFSTLLWCVLAETQRSAKVIPIERLSSRMRTLTELDTASLENLFRAFCQLGLGRKEQDNLVIRSETLVQRLYLARLAREQGKAEPGWLLSAGEQRILNCWAEAARQQDLKEGGMLSVPYCAFQDALRKHAPGLTLGVSALSRMEKNGILRMKAPKGSMKGNYNEILELLECHDILGRISTELPTLIENC